MKPLLKELAQLRREKCNYEMREVLRVKRLYGARVAEQEGLNIKISFMRMGETMV